MHTERVERRETALVLFQGYAQKHCGMSIYELPPGVALVSEMGVLHGLVHWSGSGKRAQEADTREDAAGSVDGQEGSF